MSELFIDGSALLIQATQSTSWKPSRSPPTSRPSASTNSWISPSAPRRQAQPAWSSMSTHLSIQCLRGRALPFQPMPSAQVPFFSHSVNFQSAGYLAAWKKNNPKAFDEDKVSPTVENTLFNPTFLNFHRWMIPNNTDNNIKIGEGRQPMGWLRWKGRWWWVNRRLTVERYNFNIKWKPTITRNARKFQDPTAPLRKLPSCKYKAPPTSAAISIALSTKQGRPSRNNAASCRPLIAVLLASHQPQFPPAQAQAVIIHCYSSNNHY